MGETGAKCMLWRRATQGGDHDGGPSSLRPGRRAMIDNPGMDASVSPMPPAGAAPPRSAGAGQSCIVPCKNEAKNLELLLPRLQELLPRLGLNWEVLLVDDGSTDAAAA